MEWIGYTIFALAVIEFGFGLYISFDSEGGTIGQVPVLLHAVAFPVLLTLSLLILRLAGVEWASLPGWTLLLGFPIIVFVDGYLITKAGYLGRAHHTR